MVHHIAVEEVADVFTCTKCQEAPVKPPVYTCRQGHPTCAVCYITLDKVRVSPDSRKCPQCSDPVSKNSVLGETVRLLSINSCLALANQGAPLQRTRSELSLQYPSHTSSELSLQDPSHLDKLEKARLEVLGCGDGDTYPGLHGRFEKKKEDKKIPSCRPVWCPFPCNQRVTCSGLMPHFEINHSQVPVFHVRPEVPLELPLAELGDSGEHQCIALLVVHLGKNTDSKSNSLLPAHLLQMTRSAREMLRNKIYISILSVGHLQLELDDQVQTFLAIWASSLYNSYAVGYTVTAGLLNSPHSLSYKGTLASLHGFTPITPADVYSRGECLLIPPALQSPSGTCLLTLVFHTDLDFPLESPRHRSNLPDS